MTEIECQEALRDHTKVVYDGRVSHIEKIDDVPHYCIIVRGIKSGLATRCAASELNIFSETDR